MLIGTAAMMFAGWLKPSQELRVAIGPWGLAISFNRRHLSLNMSACRSSVYGDRVTFASGAACATVRRIIQCTQDQRSKSIAAEYQQRSSGYQEKSPTSDA